MRGTRLIVMLGASALLASIVLEAAAESSSKSSSGNSSNSPIQARNQPPMFPAAVKMVGSYLSGVITNLAPLMLLFGLGALIMPALGTGAMGLLRESRRSSNEQAIPGAAFQNGLPFSQYARPLQTTPQEIYYFTKRSLPGLFSNFNSAGLTRGFQEIFEKVVQAIENADKRYN